MKTINGPLRRNLSGAKVMITTSRFCGYDKNEYGDLVVNRKEAEIVRLAFDLYLMNVGCIKDWRAAGLSWGSKR